MERQRRSKIFISYSHKDQKALEQFQRFVKPLARDGLIHSWDDTRLQGGDDWKAEIDKALDNANAAVLFISQDFIASDFIFREELPRILARADADELTVLPVFMSPSRVEDQEFPFVDRKGDERRYKLSRFQGFGKPAKPLSELSWSAREKEYEKLTKRIKELAGKATANGPNTARRPQYGLPPTARMPPGATPSRDYQLSIYLEQRGDRLDVHYYRPGTDAIASGTRPWDDTKRELEPISKLLDGADRQAITHSVAQALAKSGPVLFNLLFGPKTEWERVFRILFDQPEPAPMPNPIWASVRLRICTDQSLLLGLPWRLTTWNDRLLVDQRWEFTTGHELNPTQDYTTTAPCNVLIVAPQAVVNGITPDLAHPQAVVDVLQKAWPTGRRPEYKRVVQTRHQLANALRGMRPHLVYAYCHGTVTAGRPSLLLDGERGADALPLSELADLFATLQPRPALVYLNVAGFSGPGPSPGEILGAVVPLVFWRRLPVWEADATSRAIAWLSRWLQEGQDPVRALHDVNKDHTSAEATTLVVHSGYRTWKTQTYRQPALRERFPHLALDRDEQKALVDKHLRELVRSDKRRVMALVAYAAPGNLLHSLHRQLQYYLDLEFSDLAEINWQRLQFPDIRENLLRDLEDELKLQLQADSDEPVPHLLRRHAPNVVGMGKRGVLWLNWGVFGQGADCQKALNSEQLGAWLRFSSEFLGTHCPDDLRIVCYAAIESAKHKKLQAVLKQHRWEPWSRRPAFRLSVLPPLGGVSEEHLFDFLVDGNASCEPGIQEEIAHRLIEQTGGEFEPIATLMQEAEDGSWYDLLTRLRREQGEEATLDDEPI